MDIKATASRLMAKAIAVRIGQTRIGLLANALPPFDPTQFCTELQLETDIPLRVGLLGFHDFSTENGAITQSVESVVGWRNEDGLSDKLVVILNAQEEQPKVHSLHMLEPFNDVDLYIAICRQAEIEAGTSFQEKLWGELGRGLTRKLHRLVAEQVITLYARLQADEDIELALPAIGLLSDNEIQSYEDNLYERLKRNRDLVTWLNELDSSGMRMLARALSNDEGNTIATTFRHIKAYRSKPNNTTFARLSLQAIEAIKQAPKSQPKPKSKNTERRSASAALLADLLLLETNDEQIEETLARLREQAERGSGLFEEAVEPDYDADIERVLGRQHVLREQESAEIITYSNSEEETVYTRPTEKDKKHPLEEYLFRWIHFDCWGGVLSLDAAPDYITDVADLLRNEQVRPDFTPRKPEDRLIRLFTAMDELVASLPIRSGEALITLFESVKAARSQLIPYRTQFLYYPLDANFNPKLEQAIEAYLSSYHLLMQQLQAVCRAIQPTNPVAVEEATALFLALDSILVELVNSEQQTVYNAILTPLHPLHLWKWQKLHDALLANHIPLSGNARARVQEAARNLPTLLNTFVLHN